MRSRVEVVGHGGVHHLLRGVGALAEVVGTAHRRDQVGRDRLAGLVAGEGRQDTCVPGPLLEHLARRLDEVPLGRDAGEARPLALPAEHVVHEVAELVEQRHHLVVLHQAAAEVADQHALGQLLPGDAGDHVELRGVLELALAGVQVEVDAPDPYAVEADVVARDVVVPRAGLGVRDRGPLEAEEPAGDVEEPLAHLLEGEVGAHDLAVDVVLLAAHELGVVARVVGLDRRRRPARPGACAPAAPRARGPRARALRR